MGKGKKRAEKKAPADEIEGQDGRERASKKARRDPADRRDVAEEADVAASCIASVLRGRALTTMLDPKIRHCPLAAPASARCMKSCKASNGCTHFTPPGCRNLRID